MFLTTTVLKSLLITTTWFFSQKKCLGLSFFPKIDIKTIISFLVQNIQQNNIQKKQLLCKLMFENPDLIKNKQKNKVSPNFEACMEAVQNTPGLVFYVF